MKKDRESVVSGLQSVSRRVRTPEGGHRTRGLSSFVFRFPGDSRAFTLLELLIVVSVMMILLALLIPAFSEVREGARTKRANIEQKVIRSAIAMYLAQEGGAFPAESGTYGKGQSYGNSVVMDELLKADPPVLDVNKLRFNAAGNVIDPWGDQYTIKIGDDSFDGTRFYTEFFYSGMP